MVQVQERGYLLTEQINPNSVNLDQLTSLQLVELFNQEDHQTLMAIANAKYELAQAIDLIAKCLQNGGRLFYIGAGTSGRLGVLDAAECPPTFCTPPDLVQGIIAGGASALIKSSEALEDNFADGEKVIFDYGITEKDVLVGITAGGTTPYVHGALQGVKNIGGQTVFIACVPSEQVSADADINIRLLVGPEILAGSTRLKSGTVTKMALNILSTSVMVKLGKVYGNRMIDVSVTNNKLRDRALRIIQDLTGLNRDDADNLLVESGMSVKLTLLMHWTGLNPQEAEDLLVKNQGNLRQAVNSQK